MGLIRIGSLAALTLATHLSLTLLLFAQQSKPRFTVKDSFGWREIVTSYSDPVLVSPDRTSYLVVLQQADLSRNGSWIEFYAGKLTSMQNAVPVRVAQLFTRSKEQAMDLAQKIHWGPDSRHITFLWNDGQGPTRLVSLDVQTHQITTLAKNKARIREYALDTSGRRAFYTAERLPAARKVCGGGVPLTDETIWTLLACNSKTGRDLTQGSFTTFVRDIATKTDQKIREPEMIWGTAPELLTASSNGRFALAVRPSPTAPPEWDSYQSHILKDIYLPAARRNPHGPHLLRHYEVIDSRTATSRPLWNAPQNPYANAVWSPDSESVAIGPSFLPLPTSDGDGLAGKAVAVVNVRTGRFVTLPMKEIPDQGYAPVQWTTEGVIELADVRQYRPATGTLRFKSENSSWRLIESSPTTQSSRIRIEVRQGYNTPPAFYAIDNDSKTEKKVFDPNADFASRFRLACVELIHWIATDGRPWSGILYYPASYKKGTSYPLVIQTHGYLKDTFSLSGGYTTAFAAQELASVDIAVVQLGGPDKGLQEETATPEETELTRAGFEGLIEHLSSEGLIDQKRVGMIGFSRTGWHVEYMLTHSATRLAAAEIADSMDASYLEYVLGTPPFQSELEQDVGGVPIGEGLRVWLDRAPMFKVEKITAPLRIEIDSGSIQFVLTHWDLFTMLKRLNRPVEYFLIPDLEHGVHILQNPAQRLASQGGTVDWFCFWLKSEEDHDPAKAEQYARWRELRKLQKQNEKNSPAPSPN